MKIAVAQLNSSDAPAENLAVCLDLLDQCPDADIVAFPEVTNCVSLSRAHQKDVLNLESDEPFLPAMQVEAKNRGQWISLGSLALKTDGPKFTNRSFLINPHGEVVAKYDKIHMFDVELKNGEVYRESRGYAAGSTLSHYAAETAHFGLSICYDVRFPHLFRDLAKRGANVIFVPAAFAVATGQAHWEVLLRARAIENGAYIIAAAQTGTHPGSGRETYGHSMVIDPWGQVVLDAGKDPGINQVEIDLKAVEKARKQIPSLTHDRDYALT